MCGRCGRGNFADGPRAHFMCRGRNCGKAADPQADVFIDAREQHLEVWPVWAVQSSQRPHVVAPASEGCRPQQAHTAVQKLSTMDLATEQLRQARANAMPEAVIDLLVQQVKELKDQVPAQRPIDQRLGTARTALSAATFAYDVAVVNRDKASQQMKLCEDQVINKRQEMEKAYHEVQALMSSVACEVLANPQHIAAQMAQALHGLSNAIATSWSTFCGEPEEGLKQAVQTANTLVTQFGQHVGMPTQVDTISDEEFGEFDPEHFKLEEEDAHMAPFDAHPADEEAAEAEELGATQQYAGMAAPVSPTQPFIDEFVEPMPKARPSPKKPLQPLPEEQQQTKPSQMQLNEALLAARRRLPHLLNTSASSGGSQ